MYRSKPQIIALILITIISAVMMTSCSSETENSGKNEEQAVKPLKFGLILVGPKNDRGWSQAHYEGGQYVENKLNGEMIVIDKVNPADSPNLTVEQVASDMIEQGAKLIFATSDDMKDGILAAAKANPDTPMIWSSGDSAWSDGESYRDDLNNLGNIMGKMEYGKMIAGCSAALKSKSGNISFLGPLINDETRRLANAAYLGAQHCWTKIRNESLSDLSFKITWIGFWFHIPGVTLDPTQVVNEFFDSGSDVVISSIDTTEALVVAGQRAANGENVWALPYDFEGSCEQAPDVCLGVPYFNWGPAYLEIAKSVSDDSFSPTWSWIGPSWENINDHDKSMIGFVKGKGLESNEKESIDEFIDALASDKLNLFSGPLNFQDGSVYLKEGETATDHQIWYTKQLLEGIDGASSVE